MVRQVEHDVVEGNSTITKVDIDMILEYMFLNKEFYASEYRYGKQHGKYEMIKNFKIVKYFYL